MSEVIQKNDNRATIRWKLLTTASALALTGYIYSSGAARAEDADHPLLRIDLGGQMEQVQGLNAPFTAPFMSITPAPDVYKGVSFVGNQNAARYSFGEEGKISFQPEDSDWIFSAGIRYGRSHAKRHTHKQITHEPVQLTVFYYGVPYSYQNATFARFAALADALTQNSESHTILDFSAGKDVGLGLFGANGSSTLNAGVRIAAFTAKSTAFLTARPTHVHYTHVSLYSGIIQFTPAYPSFHQYLLHAQAARSFKGVGPTLSWNASAALAGNSEHGELLFEWGINAAMLFGKQKAKTSHSIEAYHFYESKYNRLNGDSYSLTYDPSPRHSTRSRSVTVPNIGGFAALTAQYKNAKVSIGYRYDTFLGAMDTGIDARKTSNLTFNGPYASISIGLGD